MAPGIFYRKNGPRADARGPYAFYLLVQLHQTSQMLVAGLGGRPPAGQGPPGSPFWIEMLGAAKPPLHQGFRLRRKPWTAQSAAPPAVGPRRGRTIERAPGRCPGPLCVLFTCTAPPDESDARSGPWRPLRSRRRAPWRARGRSGSGWSSGPRSSGTPDSRQRGPWSPE